MDLNAVQKDLKQNRLDGWLLYDFRRSNDLACRVLEISPQQLLTRRLFYWIPADGTPLKILHNIESHVLDHLPGEKAIFFSWQDLENQLARCLSNSQIVAMEYSPKNGIPSVSKVDAGTVELIRSLGKEVVSSANLLQLYTCVWDESKLISHKFAASILSQIADEVWELISTCLRQNNELTEYDVQQFMLRRFADHGCISSDNPICAVNAHAADPHYTPNKEDYTSIKHGDLILIDLWCKKDHPHATYADITRVAVADTAPTPRQKEVFDVVRKAQKKATDFVGNRFAEKVEVRGWEVDQVCREVITDAGFGPYFVHRTGHNIDTTDHGPGAHLDNYETHDDRLLLPRTCFSVEPGVYLPEEFGIRLEYDVFVREDGTLLITGGEQDSLVTLL